MGIKVLCADDTEVYRVRTVAALREMGYEVDEALDGKEAWKMYQKGEYDLLVLDNYMPGMNGEDIVEAIRESRGCVAAVIYTSSPVPSPGYWHQPDAWVEKAFFPFPEEMLRSAIEEAFKCAAIREEKKRRRENSFWYRLLHGKK